ncbi:peptidoglycan recognition protein-like [Macrosteles quadrilineatus]|uniref:peptidoglycan recognition protein-like n=1 Tax=Macrosteles quadrilineatus TaxID=74068 RepID=UPI0023E1FFE7|nr:peptidoglycan recognition protein-like [Macrosteles quadrilineatus]
MVIEKLRSVDPKVDMLNPPTMFMTMIERREWGARVPVYRLKTELPSDTVLLRYTGTETCKDETSCTKLIQDLQKLQIDKLNQADIMWNFMIGGDAKVYEGTGWRHTTPKEDKYMDYDFRNLDIAYIGKDNNDVTPDMRWACRKLIEHSCRLEKLSIKPVYIGEREAVDTLYTI